MSVINPGTGSAVRSTGDVIGSSSSNNIVTVLPSSANRNGAIIRLFMSSLTYDGALCLDGVDFIMTRHNWAVAYQGDTGLWGTSCVNIYVPPGVEIGVRNASIGLEVL